MSNFSWESEEDLWDANEELEESSRETDVEHRQGGVRTMTVIALLVALGLSGYWLFLRAIDVDEKIRVDVATADQLVKQATDNRDVELLGNLLSGRDPDWAAVQKDLLRQNGRYNRLRFDLVSTNSSVAAIEPQIDLAYDLQSAVVTTSVGYLAPDGNAVVLDHVDIYRIGQDRWLNAPPLDEFWGESLEHRAFDGRITATFSERDAAYARQLTDDMTLFVNAWCRPDDPILDCDDLLPLEIIFTNEPSSLLVEESIIGLNKRLQGSQFVLPTPTLFGVPQNAGGYEAMRFAYSRFLISAVSQELLGYECCHLPQPVVDLLIDYELAAGGLPTSTDNAVDFDRYFVDQFKLDSSVIMTTVRGDFDDETVAWQAGLMLAYAHDRYQERPMNILRRVLDGNPFLWRAGLFPSEIDDITVLQSDFASYVLNQTSVNVSDAPHYSGNQEILATCRNMDSQFEVWHYDFELASWRARSLGFSAAQSTAIVLADDATLLWQFQQSRNSNRPPEYALELSDGHFLMPPVDKVAEDSELFLNRFFQDDQILVFFEDDGRDFHTHNLDIDTCQNGDCASQLTTGFEIWAPDRAHYLSVDFERWIYSLYRADGTLLGQLSDMRYQPFWISDEAFILVGSISEQPSLPLYSIEMVIDGVDPESVAIGAILQEIIDEYVEYPVSRVGWQLFDVKILPSRPDTMMFHLWNDQARDASMIVLADSETFEPLKVIRGGDYGWNRISAAGNWLAMQSLNNGGDVLVDLNEGEIFGQVSIPADIVSGGTPYGSTYLDWSADEQWLVFFQLPFMSVYDVAANSYSFIPYPEGTDFCTGGGWVNN